MGFRTAYGNTHSEAGWRMCDRNECDLPLVPKELAEYAKTAPIRNGTPRIILSAWIIWYHQNVEPIISPIWGWSALNDVPTSNHLAGVALDLNAVKYPWGKRVMPADRIAKVRAGLKLFEGTVFWGADWQRADEMHYQVAFPEGDERLDAFADRLSNGHLGLFAPADPDAFPLPAGHYFGPLDGPDESVSGAYASDLPAWRTALARWQRKVGVNPTGVWDADTERVAKALQVEKGWPVSGFIYPGEWDAVIRDGYVPDIFSAPESMEYADVSQWQGIPVDESYPHRFVMFRVNNGEEVDRLAAANLAAARRMVDAGKLDGFGVYTFHRPGRDNFGTLKRVVGEPHPRMIVMLDVESAKGSTQGEVRGDQSAEAQRFFEHVSQWLGDAKRVHMGYWNRNADPGLLNPNRLPGPAKWVIPDYSAPKGQPRVTYPGWLVHQYTDKGSCAPWPNGVDMNFYPGSVAEFLREFGIEIGSDAPASAPPQIPAGKRLPFPLPGGFYFGPMDGPDESISGRWESDRDEWRAGLRKYQRKLGIPETGVFDSATADRTMLIQRNRNWPISGRVYAGEWDAVMNGDHPPLPEYADSDPATITEVVEPEGDSMVDYPTREPSNGGDVRRIGPVTGPGTSAVQFGVGGTDLGICRRLPNGKIGVFNGDTFEQFTVGGPGWRSPIMLRSSTAPENLGGGLVFDGAAGGEYAKQLWPYIHDGAPWTNGGFSTVLPTDALTIGGRVYLHVMVTRGLGNELWSEIQYSDDNGETWVHGGESAVWDASEYGGMRTHLTWDAPGDGYVYAITTGGLRRDKNALLWRVREADVLDRSKWEGWGWNGVDWGWNREPSWIFPSGFKFGEMNLRYVEGYWVLAFFDAGGGRVGMRTVRKITDNWHTARDLTLVRNTLWGLEFLNRNGTLAQPYGGYIVPGSTLDDMHVLISQWNTSSNWPYHIVQFRCKAPR